MSQRDPSLRTTPLEAFAIVLCLVGVAVLVFATGRSVGVDVGRNEVSAREHYETEKKSAISACATSDNAAFSKCVIEAVEAAEDQSKTRQDLYAQQDMSKWTFWMMIVSALTFMATALGVIWIKGTLDQTRDAVKSANDAVDVTREIGRAQSRAYVQIETLTIHVLSGGRFARKDNGKPIIYVGSRVYNSGVSQARNVLLEVEVTIGEISRQPFQTERTAPMILTQNLLGGSRTEGDSYKEPTFPRGGFTSAVPPRLRTIKKYGQVIASCILTYEDVFGQRHKHKGSYTGHFNVTPAAHGTIAVQINAINSTLRESQKR